MGIETAKSNPEQGIVNQGLIGSFPDSVKQSLEKLGEENVENIQNQGVIYNPQSGQCCITFQSGSKPIEMSGENEPIYVGLNPKYNQGDRGLQFTIICGPDGVTMAKGDLMSLPD